MASTRFGSPPALLQKLAAPFGGGLALLSVLLILALHVHRSWSLFTPAGSVLSDEPLVSGDNSLHGYYAQVGAQLIEQTGTSDGYVPWEMAGHPKSALFDAGIVPLERAMATFSFLSPALVYKLFALASLLAIGLCTLVGLLLLEVRGRSLILAWPIALFPYWWGQGLVFTVGGMNTWLFSASLCFLLIAAVTRLANHWSKGVAVLVALLLVVTPWMHPVGIVAVVISAGVLVAAPSIDRKRALLYVAAAGAVSLVVNAGWIASSATHSQYAMPMSADMGGAEGPLRLAQQAAEEIRSAPSLVKLATRAGTTVYHVAIVVAAGLALLVLRRRRDRRFIPLLVPLVGLAFLTFFSRELSAVQNLQPWRLRFLFCLVAAATAGLLIDACLRGTGWRRWTGLAGGVAGAVFFLAFDLRPAAETLQVGYDDTQKALRRTIDELTDDRSRLLVEDGNGYGRIGVIGMHTGVPKPWLGGPYSLAVISYHHMNFVEGRLAGRPIGQYSRSELGDLLQRYNVRWIMAFAPESKRALDALPDLLERVRQVGSVSFYRVLGGSPSFFERGNGELEVGLDRLRIKNAVAEGGSIVLRYHFYEHLVVKGARELRRFPVPEDPIGFIEVVGPGADVDIRSTHGRH